MRKIAWHRYPRLRWIWKSFFSPWYFTLVTLGIAFLCYWVLTHTLTWAFTSAKWEVITSNLRLFFIGIYPQEGVWRLWVVGFLVSLLIGVTWKLFFSKGKGVGLLLLLTPCLLSLLPLTWTNRICLWVCTLCLLMGSSLLSLLIRSKKWVILSWVIYLPIVVILVGGLTPGGILFFVDSSYWSGLLLTFLIAIVGILFSFPLGVLLALGRRSQLPIIRTLCVLYIEIIRGIPLITLLFMMQVMLPLFLPEGISIDRVLRAMGAFICFSGAYLAENIRGGLQGIPKGQYEASYALGLSHLRTLWVIVLPQALRNVIPILVGQFIALFKDTSLVAVVGLLDFLGISQSILANPNFLGTQKEVFLFIGLVYWLFSWSLSLASQKLEKHLKVEGYG